MQYDGVNVFFYYKYLSKKQMQVVFKWCPGICQATSWILPVARFEISFARWWANRTPMNSIAPPNQPSPADMCKHKGLRLPILVTYSGSLEISPLSTFLR